MVTDRRLLLIVPVMLLLMCPFIVPDSDGATVSSIVFHGNGGLTDDLDSEVTYAVTTGNVIELPTLLFGRSGYYLDGFTVNGTNGTVHSAGAEYTVSGDVDLYAHWIKVPDGTFVQTAPDTGSLGMVYSFNLYEDLTLSELQSENMEWYHITQAMRGAINFTYIHDMPSWLSVEFQESDRSILTKQYTLTFSGSPASPGNHLVKVGCTNSANSSYDATIYWLINVPSSGDMAVSLTYDANGGTDVLDGNGSPLKVMKPSGSAIVLEGEGSTTKDGYTLVGWDLPDGKGSTPTYALNSMYTITEDVVAVAHWVSEPNVLVYSLDGGSLSNVDAYVVYTNETVTLHSSGVERDGYTFLGWRPSNDPTYILAPGLTMRINGAYYLEAYFVQDDTDLCTVTYNANGGTGNIGSQKVGSGMWVKLPEYGFVRSGYTFLGWSTDRNATEPRGSSDYQVASDLTLYAVWSDSSGSTEPEDDWFTVVFDSNGGNQSVDIQYLRTGSLVSEPTGIQRDGFILDGWRDLESGQRWTFASDVVTTDLLLQADWVEHFTITIDGLDIRVSLSGSFASLNNAVVNWGDGSTEPIVSGTATHSYLGSISEYIIVTTSSDSVRYDTSRMPFAVVGDHIPDYPSVDPDPDDPSHGGSGSGEGVTAVIPIPTIKVRDNGDGTFTLDGSGSQRAVVHIWYLDGVGIGSTTTITTKVLEDGDHTITLIVKSETGHSRSVDVQVHVGDDADEKDNSLLIIAGLVAVLVAILVVGRFLI